LTLFEENEITSQHEPENLIPPPFQKTNKTKKDNETKCKDFNCRQAYELHVTRVLGLLLRLLTFDHFRTEIAANDLFIDWFALLLVLLLVCF
jgi:hypothetical protein